MGLWEGKNSLLLALPLLQIASLLFWRGREQSAEVLWACEQAADMTTALLSLWSYFFSKPFALYALSGGLSMTSVEIEIPRGRCWLLLLQSLCLGYVNVLPQQQQSRICCRSLG